MDGAKRQRWSGEGPSVLRRVRGAALPPGAAVAVLSPMRFLVALGLLFRCRLALAAMGASAGAGPAAGKSPPGGEPATPSVQPQVAAAPPIPAARAAVPSAAEASVLTQAPDETVGDVAPTRAARPCWPEEPSVLHGTAGVTSLGATGEPIASSPGLEGALSVPAPGPTSAGSSRSSVGARPGGAVGCPAALTGNQAVPPVLRSWLRRAPDSVAVIGGTNVPGARPG